MHSYNKTRWKLQDNAIDLNYIQNYSIVWTGSVWKQANMNNRKWGGGVKLDLRFI